MLKVYGGIYSNTKDDFDVMAKALSNEGFQIAYQNETSGTVIKEVQTLDESENTES